jgi:radical SAM protein with 4Fe4S-binding SPASM domain
MADDDTVITLEQSGWIRETVKKIDSEEYNLHWDTQVYSPIVAHSCWAFMAGCGIRVNGDISACPETPVVGNAFKTPLKELFRTNYFMKCRNFHNTVGEPCKSCEDLNICAGGCRSKANAKLGDEYALDPYCPLVNKEL